MSDDSDQDLASLKASLITALMAARNHEGGESFEELLANLDANVARSDWSLTLARHFKPGLDAWLARPWCCFQLRKVRHQLLRTEDFAPDGIDLLQVTRLLVLANFGVDVNSSWFRRLRDVSGKQDGGEARLKRLLSSPYVWWGGLNRQTSNWFMKRVWRLCATGRPAHGELHYARPHPWVIWLLLVPVLLGLTFLFVSLSTAFQLGTRMSIEQFTAILLITARGCILLWVAWWLGPYGARCIRDLELILGPCPGLRGGARGLLEGGDVKHDWI